MGASGLNKFKLLMWKNWLLQWRHPVQTIVEILAPVLFSALLVLLRSLVDPTVHTETTHFHQFDIGSEPQQLPFAVVYSPNNDNIKKIIMNVQTQMKLLPWVNSPFNQGFDNASEMDNFFISNNFSKLVLCGIQFDDQLLQIDNKPPELTPVVDVKIRFPAESRFSNSSFVPSNWQTNLLFPLYQIGGPRNPTCDDGGYPSGYNEEKFLSIQHHLSYGIINYFKNKEISDYAQLPSINLQRYPYPPYIEDPLLLVISSFISVVILLSFVYTCINTVKAITSEKEKQLKEAMKIMGLPNWLHWTAWFLKTFSFMLISVILMVVLMKVHWKPDSEVSIFTYSDASVIFVFLVIYMCTSIMFCFMISVFFSRANIAATVTGLMWFLFYAPYLFLQQKYDQLSLTEKIVSCLGSNTAMAYGFQFIIMNEGTGAGLQWSTVWKPITPDDDFVLGHIIIMLIADGLIYLLVALYVEAVFPGQYGVPLPWYFPFTKSYWCGVTNLIKMNKNVEIDDLNKDIYEAEPNLPIGIQIKHLRKQFGNKKVAVRDLTLNLYESQITVLLGHNGAGKTTTMSMLTGIYPPTSGTATVAGHDIITDMPGVRASLGLCPQHNILFDDMTVQEHIYFFSKLKGLNSKEIKHEIDKYIGILELVPKAKSLSKTLSGGMKRKLSVCVALCGNSKVVILDEPTAGMDPAARRALWDLLQEEKKNRTLLLSTHFMDEADLLGDRIAIMAGGSLQCCGSSFFLKKRYGTGYHLTMEKTANCNTKKVTDLLQKHIPMIQIQSNVGSELTYLLSEDKLPYFEPMLKDLEDHSSSLGIVNYGISLTTLEEVFMKVGADHGQEEEQNALEINGVNTERLLNGGVVDIDMNLQSSNIKLNTGERLLTGCSLYINQFMAMMMKKVFSTFRSWILLLVQMIIPLTFLIITIIVVRSWKSSKDLPPLEISLNSYNDPYTIINGDNPFKDSYINLLNENKNTYFDIKDDFGEYIVEKSKENLPKVRLRYIAGASFNSTNSKSTIKAWFNNEPFHSSPLTLNLLHNAILQKTMNSSYSISITNYPQPFSLNTKLNNLANGNNIGFQIAFNIGFSMAFVSSFYVIFCVRERVSKAKHLQFVSGVNVFIFWITSYLWDMITFIFTAILLVITLAIFQEEGFSKFDELGRFLLSLMLFGHAMLPLMYLTSFLFSIPSTGYTRMALINIFTGVAGFLVVEVLGNPGLDLKDIAEILEWIFLLIPHYGISNAIRNLNNIYSVHKICDLFGEAYWENMCKTKQQCCGDGQDYFAWKSPGIGRNLTFFGFTGCLFFSILIFIEYRVFDRIVYAIKFKNIRITPPLPEGEDEDVTNERTKVNGMSLQEIGTQQLVLRDFSKYYNRFLAVQRLSLTVSGNECFGLLGINGAGKTTTFKMLTGDEKISYGEAWVNGLSLKTSMKEVHQRIGYCPQFDALLDDLTGRETMKIFCLLRGVPWEESGIIIQTLAEEFGFTRHLNKKVREYSGGNKRKLSTALALIGDPYVIYLDEPTTGMDPAAKRYLWNALCKVRDNGKCIILTSHSMEECEALCTRLAIMVNGNFKCLGSTQRLKSKFSEGYTLTVKVKKQDGIEIHPHEVKPIEQFIKENFPSAVLREKYQELLTYYISDTSTAWSRMFGIMEQGKQVLAIEDYSLGQATLEQVFLKFTKHQRDEND